MIDPVQANWNMVLKALFLFIYLWVPATLVWMIYSDERRYRRLLAEQAAEAKQKDAEMAEQLKIQEEEEQWDPFKEVPSSIKSR